MGAKSTITLTVGVSGSGKTYYRGSVFVMEEWLPEHTGILITNMPLNLDEIEKVYPNARERIELIPREVLQSWRDGNSGPWEYLQDRDLSGCKLQIDEIHNYCGKNSSNSIRKKWLSFIGELRHQGLTAEFMTQTEAKCAKEIISEAEIRIEIVNGENRLMPILGYRMGDLYELRAKLTGKYLCPSFCREFTQVSGKWHMQKEQIFYRLPYYFKFYDSYSAPEHGKAKGAKAELHPYERYGFIRLLAWFYLQYPIRIGLQLIIVGFFVWFFFLGGVKTTIHKYFDAVTNITSHAMTGNFSPESEKKSVVSNENSERSRQKTLDSSKNKKPANNSDAYNEKGEKVGKWVIERWVSKVSFATTKYIRLRTGKRLSVGDYYHNKKIIIIDLDKKELVFEDLSFISFEQIED